MAGDGLTTVASNFGPEQTMNWFEAQVRFASVRRQATVFVLVSVSALFSLHALADSSKRVARNADVCNGLNHQPTRSEVETRERVSGIAPNSRQQSDDDAALELLYEKLERNVGID